MYENKNFEAWNEEQYYNDEIVPLIKMIAAKCDERKISVLISAIYSDTDKGVGKCLVYHPNIRDLEKSSNQYLVSTSKNQSSAKLIKSNDLKSLALTGFLASSFMSDDNNGKED